MFFINCIFKTCFLQHFVGISVALSHGVCTNVRGGRKGGGATGFTLYALHAIEQQAMPTDPRLSIGNLNTWTHVAMSFS